MPKTNPLRIALAALALAFTLASAAVLAVELKKIELVCIDEHAAHFATFQSHNQRIVRNRRGIFLTQIHSRNSDYTAQEWRVLWSQDGGATFTTLFSATSATNPPVLVSDADDNLYVGRPDFVDRQAYLYRFLAREVYRTPHISRIPDGNGGKYFLLLDPKRRQLYWISHNHTFTRLDLEGRVLSTTRLIAPDNPHATIGYPHLSLDVDGVLHAAWTTVMVPAPRPVKPIYWDIHYLQSPDGGLAWRTMAGTPVSVPVRADNSGPSDRITLDDEYGASNWLANFLVRDGQAHFLYLSEGRKIRQHYMRFDLATARRDVDHQPEFRGDRLRVQHTSGFFAADARTLYCVSHDPASSRLVCLASSDRGATWRDYAVSDPGFHPYALGGCHDVAPDGLILGSFTENAGGASDDCKVYFIRIATAVP